MSRPWVVQIDTVASRPPTHLGDLPGQTARIKRLRRITRNPIGVASTFCAPLAAGRTIIAGRDVGTQCGVSVGDLADHPDRGLRREPEPALQLGVEAFLRIMFAMQSSACIAADSHDAALLHVFSVAPRLASSLDRQHAHLDHLLHDRHVTAGTDRSLLRLAMNGQAFDKGGRREIGGYRR